MNKKYSAIRDVKQSLLERIVHGGVAPGERLPTQAELLQDVEVSSATLQKAMDELKEEGFIYARPRSGSFVSEHPPHLSRYGLIFGSYEEDCRDNEFFRSLFQVARHIEQSTSVKIATYHDVNGHEDSEGYARLLDDIRGTRLAGGILVTPDPALSTTQFWDEVHIPLVQLGESRVLDVPRVHLDRGHYMEKALGYLEGRGRSRIALITTSGLADQIDTFEREVGKRKMTTRPYWVQVTGLDAAAYTSNIAHVIMRSGDPAPPDGLLICDDNLVDSAIVGLSAAGVRIGKDVDVVAHANFPVNNEPLAPIKRLGYDARQIMQTCLDILNGDRTEEEMSGRIAIPAVLDDELETGKRNDFSLYELSPQERKHTARR